MRLGVCIAVLLVFALAQDVVAQRSPVFVTVTDAKGEPLVGAEVVCGFASDMLTPLPSDVVKATTDKRGRARCNLLLGRVYCAWAVGPKQADGGYYVSRVKRLVSSGRLLELDAQYWRRALRVKLHDVAAWRQLGAVGIRWFPVATQDHSFEVLLPDADVAELPGAAWNDGCLALTGKDGGVLTTAKVQAEGGADVWFDEPMRCDARVAGPDDQPIAGAKIEVMIPRMDDQRAIFDAGVPASMFRVPVGVTKADGTLQFHAAEYVYREYGGVDIPQQVCFLASKPGYTTAGQIVRQTGTFELRLAKSEKVPLAFVGDDAGKLSLAASHVEEVSIGNGQRTWVPKPVPLTALGDGRWTFPEVGDYLHLRAAVVAKLPRAVVINQNLPEEKLWAIRLAAQETMDVQVTDSAGQPAPCVLGVALVDDQQLDWHGLVATNIAGRAQVVVPREHEYFVYATTGSAHAMELLDVGKKGPVTMQLEEIPSMRVHVVNNVGQSMVLVTVAQTSSPYPGPRTGATSVTRRDLWMRLARGLSAPYCGSVCSDRNGILNVPVFWKTGKLTGRAVRGDWISKGFKLAAGGEAEVVLRRR